MRRALLVTTFAVAVTALSACGGGSKTSSANVASTTAESTASTSPPRFATATEQEVAALAERYVHGLASGDYEAACATRSTAGQAELARLGGSCARAIRAEVQAKGGTAGARLFAETTAGSVSVHGNKAAIGIVQPGQTHPALILVASHERVGWRLIEAPDAEAAKLLKR
jgi:hypothetical protein